LSGFAYVVTRSGVRALDAHDAIQPRRGFVWIHLTSRDEEVQAWLRDVAKLDRFTVEALTALETRPRCDQINGGAVLNLRGMTHAAMRSSDPLASIRLYAEGDRVISVTRLPLDAVDIARAAAEAGDVRDAGDLIATLAEAITEQLDPQVADLGDSLDSCEEQLDARQAFELRKKVNVVPRQSLIAVFSIRSAWHWRSWRPCPSAGWATTTGCTSAAPPIAPRAWPRNWRASANAPP
jgi:zinc transporter